MNFNIENYIVILHLYCINGKLLSPHFIWILFLCISWIIPKLFYCNYYQFLLFPFLYNKVWNICIWNCVIDFLEQFSFYEVFWIEWAICIIGIFRMFKKEYSIYSIVEFQSEYWNSLFEWIFFKNLNSMKKYTILMWRTILSELGAEN